MANKKTIFPLLALFLSILLLLTACSTEEYRNNILITHSDQPAPDNYPADVQYNYVIRDGYKLPKDDMLVTFAWKRDGSNSQRFWMFEVKESEKGYTVLGTDYEGFYVEDITELGYSPISHLTQEKGTITIRVENEVQYHVVVGQYPQIIGTHLFEDILVKEDN